MLDVNSMTPLSTEQIRSKASSIFQNKGAEKMSDKYIHIPTSRVIEDMEKLGWFVTEAKEVKSRKADRIGFQKHLLIFRNNDIIIEGEDGDIVIPQIFITNSHDGSSCFEFRAGIFRMICENGLVVATKEFEKMKIRHMGYNFEEVQKVMERMLEQIPMTVESMNTMRGIELNKDQSMELAGMIVGARFGNEAIESMNIDLEKLLTPIRKEDEFMDLFTVMNVLQEKVMGGDFNYSNGTKTRKARQIKNFQTDIEVNQKIFSATHDFMNSIAA
jgi:hypothetical protein